MKSYPAPSRGVPDPARLPDFRNMGVLFRGFLLAELANFLFLYLDTQTVAELLARAGGSNPLFEITVLMCGLLLLLLSPLLAKLRYELGLAVVVALTALVAGGLSSGINFMVGGGFSAGGVKSAVVGGVLASVVLAYFDWRQRTLSPALAQARLMALQARIRPHFLFNSINTAVALVREDPATAERVLLDLSDLFRALLADGRGLVPFERELALAKAYAEIEQLRLGDRLRIRWACDRVPDQVLVPMLMLQPLLENAVHHGIEPRADGGDVSVEARVKERSLIIEVRNTLSDTPTASGNQMALANIEERLSLYYDAEAQLRAGPRGDRFVVRVVMPLRFPEKKMRGGRKDA